MTTKAQLIDLFDKLSEQQQLELLGQIKMKLGIFPTLEELEAMPKHPTRRAGCMQGTFVMAPDFDEPLEDFKEYI